jgi:hypothetical protein
MTLLEIMIVLAIIALVMGLLVGPMQMRLFGDSKRDIAKLAVHQLADQDYPVWVIRHTSDPCPHDVTELTGKKLHDPWGSDYQLHCGTTAPAEVSFGASSLAQDRQPATADDILSWRD